MEPEPKNSTTPNPVRTRVTLVPHTHWDREWYRPFDEFLKRLVTMMDTLLDIGDRGFPHFHLDGQTAMIDDYLAVRPEREADVRRLASQGRLSLGPWVTQMDEFLTSGESHIRNLERGLERAEELGPPLRVGYLPDQFGHIGQMPQILRLAGIDRAIVWRGVPEAIDRTAFWWEAPDGSRVLTEYLAFGYFNGAELARIREPEALADGLRRSVDRLGPFLVGDQMLVMVGSDHAGPDTTLPRRLREAAPLAEGISAEIAGLTTHLEGRHLNQVPVWRGELRSSARAHLLPNVVSARVHQKRERGRIEALLERVAEPLAALVPGFEWPTPELDRAWLLLLWNGAHDSACGCSHDQVARDVDARFAEARDLIEGVADRALATLGEQVGRAGVLSFNPSTFEREGVPGLGWRVEPAAPTAGEVPVALEVRERSLVADGIELTLRDEPDVGDLYTFCESESGQRASPPHRLELRGDRVAASWDELSVRLRILRREDEPFLRLEGEIENRKPDHRLRLHVSLPHEAKRSIAGSPFELVDRARVSEGSDLESPSPTWPARGVVMAGGLALLHEGVFEYEVTDDGELAVTLLRCVGTVSRKVLDTRPFAAGPDVATPDGQMIGSTEFSLGIFPATRREDLLPAWDRFALPLPSRTVSGGGSLPASGTLLEIANGAELSNVRRRGGAIEIRIWNQSADSEAEATVGGKRRTLRRGEIATIRLPADRAGGGRNG
jgi:glycosyl hydrolase family 38/alpha mannosidase-like protein